jgi:ABC-2 type transport system permease protein
MGSSVRNIATIAGKELRSYFGSPVAWVLMGLFAVIFGWFYNVYLNYFVQQAMQSQFGPPPSQNVNDQMIRMRAYAEEKRSGTIELLLTSPVTDLEITFGKFFAAVGVYLGLLAVTLVYVLVLFGLGRPEWKPIISGYLGLLLLGCCFISIGLFISSTTKNQIVAGTATFVTCLFFWIINWFSDSAGPTVGAVLSYLSVTQHFEDFGRGIIDTKHLVFYASFIVFGLFLTLKSVDTERWRG